MSSAAGVLTAALLLAAGCAGGAGSASVTLGTDPAGRPTLPVRVDGKGPFVFVLDTAAERTMVQGRLADSLGMGALPGVSVRVQATGGEARSRMFLARRLASPLFSRALEPVFELPSAGIVRADGILGMNVFTGVRLAFDFGAGTAAVGPSGPAPTGWTTVPARLERGDLAIVPVVVDGVRVDACVDTGARRTMGNPALARALGLADGDPRFQPARPVTGASRDSVAARRATVGAVSLGGARFERAEVTFADAPVFARMVPGGGPALVLGIDLLRTLHGLALDYPRAEVQVRP